MIKLSVEDFKKYNTRLDNLNIPAHQEPHYVKWVRYFLDFESKYGAGRSGQELIAAFIAKLSGNRRGYAHRRAGLSSFTLIWMARSLE